MLSSKSLFLKYLPLLELKLWNRIRWVQGRERLDLYIHDRSWKGEDAVVENLFLGSRSLG